MWGIFLASYFNNCMQYQAIALNEIINFCCLHAYNNEKSIDHHSFL